MIENRKKVYILITGGFFVYLIIYWKYFESSSILPSTEYLDAKSASDLEELYHGLMGQIQVKCNKITRVGSYGDGGWNVCLDNGYYPKKPCLVYAFGIGLDSSFDVEMKILYGCEVHSFDPFVPKSQIPYLLSLNYHAIGISGETGIVNGTQFMTLLDIRKHLNHTEKNISILKMDVENDEWNSLIKAMYDGELDHVKQLLVEFHSHFSAASKWNVHRNALNVVKKLMDFNFRIFSIGKNKACLYISDRDILLTKCYNVHMVKVS
ncbi:probable methyltransferase-like protein 24 isoform X1 [Octopus bimaculoides]|uniref:Methyltransferase domain-containing protein n=2 Tax=Octopus bimaculoides TaxID=37653 RepID=A0A0L8IDD3_OCTBM|nr:probable methyltransferase-like protein 24 isoform X1 [Octopus bimaculoides]|eukprot:XP_014775426.1 PREDICTED: methyltransferase-like protein 24 isoform X1 [Octopus bimaculoides]